MRLAALLRVMIPGACWLAAALTLGAQQTMQIPAATGYVNDFAGVLPADIREGLVSLSTRVNTATRGDMVIVTMSDIGDRNVADVAREIGRQWKVGANAEIGDKARNAGVIILVVPKESSSSGRGACRIETGQGAEGFITDATSGSICREATPYFVQKDYGRGIELVATRVAQRYAREFNVSLDGVPPPEPAARPEGRSGRSGGAGILVVILLIVIISSLGRRGRGGGSGGCLNMLPFILASTGSSNNRGGWGGGGGGFGGGGGGGFGGFGGGGGFSGGGGGSEW